MQLSGLIHLILVYRYWILFPIACFEGPVTGFIIGTLVALGYFNPFAAYALLVAGDVIPDWGYYLLGRYGANRKFVKNILRKAGLEDHMAIVRKLWHEHGGKTMFFSKLAYGLSTPFLISAGLAGLEPGKFLLYALPVTLFQYLVLMSLGYYFSNSFNIVSGLVEHAQIFIAGIVVIFFLYYLLTRYMRTRLLKQQAKEEKDL